MKQKNIIAWIDARTNKAAFISSTDDPKWYRSCLATDVTNDAQVEQPLHKWFMKHIRRTCNVPQFVILEVVDEAKAPKMKAKWNTLLIEQSVEVDPIIADACVDVPRVIVNTLRQLETATAGEMCDALCGFDIEQQYVFQWLSHESVKPDGQVVALRIVRNGTSMNEYSVRV